MKKFNQFMILQWLIFLPLILPLSIVSGILQGVKHSISDLFEQISNDVSHHPLIHEENPDSFV